jgi:hypothetical protein
MPVLPSFKSFLFELPGVLDWLNSGIEENRHAQLFCVFEKITEVKHMSISDLPFLGGQKLIFNRVRMAASNRLLVNLFYENITHKVECYSLGHNFAGKLILGAIKTVEAGVMILIFEKIQKLEVTNESFSPRFKVDIGSSTTIAIHNIANV